jgi:hypothetical protein
LFRPSRKATRSRKAKKLQVQTQRRGNTMTVMTFEEYPTEFESTSDFVNALNDYNGDNIWQDLIYGAEIESDKIDAERSTEADGCIIYLTSGATIVYSESEKTWH